MILECVWFEGKRVEENKITKPIDKLRLELVQIYSSISIILISSTLILSNQPNP
jgi:hypothetical protein